MPGKFVTARRAPIRIASALAMAAALGATLGGAPALAQGRPAAPAAAPVYTPAFVQAFQPLAAIVDGPTGDYAAVRAQLPALMATAVTADDRHAMGNLVLNLGTKLSDKALQRQGLEAMVASGKVAPAQIGQVQFILGGLAYEARDFAAARTALLAAQAAGYQDEGLAGLLAESYFGDNQAEAGLQLLKAEIDRRRAAGTAVPDSWLRRALQVAYNSRLVGPANDWSAMLARTNPSAENWSASLQVVAALNGLDPQAQLDLLRLMSLTDSFTNRDEYVRYIEAADPRVMSNEVSRVLAAAVAKGMLTTGDTYYQDVKRVVDPRTSQDRAEAPRLVAAARRATTGGEALNAGDVLYSLESYAEAEEMYALALTKGGIDRDRVLTRIGIAQAHQGKNAEAKANFAQVGGTRAPVAQMWQAYVDSRG